MAPPLHFPRRPWASARAGATVQQLLLIAVVSVVLAGCRTIDNDLRMPATSSIDSSAVLGTNIANYNDTNLPYNIRLYNIDPDGSFKVVSGIDALNPDLYVTVDVAPIVNQAVAGQIDKNTRNNLVGFMLYLSDRNTDIWESRVYARYKTRKALVGGLRDLANVGAGASALIIPPVAVGLSAASLIVSPISDDIDTTLYSGDTVETMIKAIAASRHTYKNTIRMHFTNEVAQYDMFFALDQLRHYDSLVSFRKGLAYAASLADKQTTEQDNIANTNLDQPSTNSSGATPPPKTGDKTVTAPALTHPAVAAPTNTTSLAPPP
jgi:hypothetical protein